MPYENLDKMVADELGQAKTESNDKPMVVVVDDDIELLDSLSLILGDRYTLLLCEDADTGVEAITRDTHAVVLDIKLSNKSGFETYSEIKKKSPHVPVIFYSAYTDEHDPYEVINHIRPFGFIQKGASSAVLLETLSSAVDYYRQVQHNELLIERLGAVKMELDRQVVEQALALEKARAELNRVIAIDPQTGLFTRRVLLQNFKSELARSNRHGHDVTLALVSIDGYDSFTPDGGNDQTEAVLIQASQILLAGSRLSDISGRVGESEFAVLLPETGQESSHKFAERLRAAFASAPILIERDGKAQSVPITVSIGLATVPASAEVSGVQLLATAEQALDEAREAGGNRWQSALVGSPSDQQEPMPVSPRRPDAVDKSAPRAKPRSAKKK